MGQSSQLDESEMRFKYSERAGGIALRTTRGVNAGCKHVDYSRGDLHDNGN